jgi:hypothetical protein
MCRYLPIGFNVIRDEIGQQFFWRRLLFFNRLELQIKPFPRLRICTHSSFACAGRADTMFSTALSRSRNYFSRWKGTTLIVRSSIARGIAAVNAVGLVLLGLSGCAGARPEFVEVRGRATLNGKPLAGVVVTFYPENDDKEALPYSRGRTDSSGTFALATADGRTGAAVGKHRVVVQWPTPDRGDNWEKAPPTQPKGPAIPLKYTTAIDTPFVFEVKPGGPQTFDLALLAE